MISHSLFHVNIHLQGFRFSCPQPFSPSAMDLTPHIQVTTCQRCQARTYCAGLSPQRGESFEDATQKKSYLPGIWVVLSNVLLFLGRSTRVCLKNLGSDRMTLDSGLKCSGIRLYLSIVGTFPRPSDVIRYIFGHSLTGNKVDTGRIEREDEDL